MQRLKGTLLLLQEKCYTNTVNQSYVHSTQDNGYNEQLNEWSDSHVTNVRFAFCFDKHLNTKCRVQSEPERL